MKPLCVRSSLAMAALLTTIRIRGRLRCSNQQNIFLMISLQRLKLSRDLKIMCKKKALSQNVAPYDWKTQILHFLGLNIHFCCDRFLSWESEKSHSFQLFVIWLPAGKSKKWPNGSFFLKFPCIEVQKYFCDGLATDWEQGRKFN